MSSETSIERLPSTWRLAILQAITVITSVALCLTLAGWALRSDLDGVARGIALDDLGEFSVFYRDKGVKGVEDAFEAGHHNEHHALRVVTADGGTSFEKRMDGFEWPDAGRLRKLGKIVGLVAVEHPSNDPHVLIGRVPLNDGAVLWYGRSDAEDAQYVGHIRDYLWYAGAAAALLGLMPVFWYAGQVLHPVRAMIASAHALARGAGDARLTASSAVPELKEFAAAFNLALDRNSALTSELQSANDNLAHELRTPLARIRANLEALNERSTNPELREATERGMDEIDHAAGLIQRILTIRGGEHDALKLHREPTSLIALLEDIIETYASSAEDRQMTLILEAPDDVTLEVDQQMLTQAVANLLDNALSYSPKGSAVKVLLGVNDTDATIRVQDNGHGIKPGEMQGIWKRFVRGSVASAGTPGMGLGLSLVQAVAKAHGGSAGCENREGGGAEFWIRLLR